MTLTFPSRLCFFQAPSAPWGFSQGRGTWEGCLLGYPSLSVSYNSSVHVQIELGARFSLFAQARWVQEHGQPSMEDEIQDIIHERLHKSNLKITQRILPDGRREPPSQFRWPFLPHNFVDFLIWVSNYSTEFNIQALIGAGALDRTWRHFNKRLDILQYLTLGDLWNPYPNRVNLNHILGALFTRYRHVRAYRLHKRGKGTS